MAVFCTPIAANKMIHSILFFLHCDTVGHPDGTMTKQISGVESMMRQAHDALADLLLKSGTGDVQNSSLSSCNLRHTGDGMPEDVHNERRRPLSSACCHTMPATATVDPGRVKLKSPSRSVDRPRRRIPGALWSLSKTVGEELI